MSHFSCVCMTRGNQQVSLLCATAAFAIITIAAAAAVVRAFSLEGIQLHLQPRAAPPGLVEARPLEHHRGRIVVVVRRVIINAAKVVDGGEGCSHLLLLSLSLSRSFLVGVHLTVGLQLPEAQNSRLHEGHGVCIVLLLWHLCGGIACC